MRMSETALTVNEWASFLAYTYDRGVRKLHSSDEYDSFPLFCEVLKTLKQKMPNIIFNHIVKLAVPSFDDPGFDAKALAQKVDAYRIALGTEIVHDVQWMWRSDLKDEDKRLEMLTQSSLAIDTASKALKASGVIARFFCFPYTIGCAKIAIDLKACDGLVVYRNDKERDFDPLLDECFERGKNCMIIRPFLGGELLGNDNDDAKSQLERALSHPAVEAAIFSTSQQAHFDALLG